ncbi:YdeI/OmpD-associated family protein [Flavobacterium sp. SM15]|uniref:YdeI/OmpD-associated family protein n=1 Tax=Flavobacterium sp. SM15 TaxID=2908005 RepID=UPI001EDAB126|nr:YdeI/OmpD-associated family protein [Flavobacterium sp. SM15]MCG2610500.1 YdeI/OmpD-associated family protein [Flavobacterium sp. SM15]
MRYSFQAEIYKIGINWTVDVPLEITEKLSVKKGYIRIKGTINGFAFNKSLVPVKEAPYRLFVNLIMMKGAKTAIGQRATFCIEQDTSDPEKEYPMPNQLAEQLKENQLEETFNNLTFSRRKEIVRYLSFIKTEKTFQRNIEKVIAQLKEIKKTS